MGIYRWNGMWGGTRKSGACSFSLGFFLQSATGFLSVGFVEFFSGTSGTSARCISVTQSKINPFSQKEKRHSNYDGYDDFVYHFHTSLKRKATHSYSQGKLTFNCTDDDLYGALCRGSDKKLKK